MAETSNTPRVASKLEDLKWFEAVVVHSEQILSEVPEAEKSSWYRKYETSTADQLS